MAINHGRAAAVLLAALLAAMVLARVASAQTVGTTSFPGSTGAIAFVSVRDGNNQPQVYRMNADGFGQTRLTDETPGINWEPAWSPDGTRIAFGNFDANFEIYQMKADGSDEKNLTNAGATDQNPAYSSTSNKIAFTSDRSDSQPDIYLTTIGASGQTTELVRLTTSDAQDSYPAVSPDGKRIAFVSDRDGDDDIYVMKAAKESATNRPVKLTKNAVNDGDPDWSPDGRQIVFSSDRSGDSEIYRMKVSPEGRLNKPVNLSKNGAVDSSPAWSPDGKKIAFGSNRDGDPEIWKMRATDGANPTNLTDNSITDFDFDPEWQPLP